MAPGVWGRSGKVLSTESDWGKYIYKEVLTETLGKAMTESPLNEGTWARNTGKICKSISH